MSAATQLTTTPMTPRGVAAGSVNRGCPQRLLFSTAQTPTAKGTLAKPRMTHFVDQRMAGRNARSMPTVGVPKDPELRPADTRGPRLAFDTEALLAGAYSAWALAFFFVTTFFSPEGAFFIDFVVVDAFTTGGRDLAMAGATKASERSGASRKRMRATKRCVDDKSVAPFGAASLVPLNRWCRHRGRVPHPAELLRDIHGSATGTLASGSARHRQVRPATLRE